MKKRRKSLIIACDFDGTIVEDAFPNIGRPKVNVINFLKDAHKKGHRIIIWTCRTQEYAQQAMAWLKHWGVPFDEFNDNVETTTFHCRKVLADIYLDDKALNVDDLDSFDLETMDFDNSEMENDLLTLLNNCMDTSVAEYVGEKYGFRMNEDLSFSKVG